MRFFPSVYVFLCFTYRGDVVSYSAATGISSKSLYGAILFSLRRRWKRGRFSSMMSFLRSVWQKIVSFFPQRKPIVKVVEPPPAHYVVVDLEWNQYPKWVRTPVSKEGVVMPHEIIQIGAVKVDAQFNIIDTFVACVKLQGRRRLSKHVARVINKTQEEIDQGEDFPVAYAHFSDWSADAERFITWGTDDIRVFQNNLAYYGMGALDPRMWFDGQMIYAKQVRGDTVQTALAKAAETLGVYEDVQYHDALADAYITVSVCRMLRMKEGMRELRQPRPRPQQAEPQRISENKLFMKKKFVSAGSEGGFETRALCKQHCQAAPVCCPVCETVMHLEPGRVVSGDRWMRMAECKEHGRHLARYRIRRKADGEFVWTRTLYAQDAELARYFDDKLASARQQRPPRRHARPKKPAIQQEAAPAAQLARTAGGEM